MQLLKNKRFLAILAFAALATIVVIGALGGTLADGTDYTKTYNDPYPSYTTVLEAGKSATTSSVAGAYTWSNADSTVLKLTWTTGADTATVEGVKPGVSTVSAGTSSGLVSALRYKVVDNSNIKSYTLSGGVEGRITKKSDTLTIPVIATNNLGNTAAQNKIEWASLNTSVATVTSNSGVITAVDNGAAIILGTFTDPWGLVHTIPYLVIVGSGGGTPPPSNLVEGEDGKWYKPLPHPPHVYEKVDKDGNSNQPPEYVYSADDKPGSSTDKPAIPDNGSFWVEDPAGSNIWKPVDNNGNLSEEGAIWGGGNGKPGGGDDQPVKKFGDDYWVNKGQNVWQKVDKNSSLGPLGPLTGGGPDKNPVTSPATPIVKEGDKYYVGPLGPDADGNMYYYGDPAGGNGLLDSTGDSLFGDDVKYYKHSDGSMKTTPPSKPITNEPSPEDGRILTQDKTGDSSDWIEIARNGDYSLIIRKNHIVTRENNSDLSWQLLPFGTSTAYNTSTSRDKINSWFKGTVNGTATKLPANARLRSFTVANNALDTPGTASTTAGLSNGYSKPSAYLVGDGNDVAFILSYGEAANFISVKHDVRGKNPEQQPSSTIAKANFAKLNHHGEYIWLRSAGDGTDTVGVIHLAAASHNQHGRAFQLLRTESAVLHPALWVHKDVFDSSKTEPSIAP